MKVLLVKPPEPQKQVEVIGSRITEHLGLGYIAAVLRKNSIDVEILDCRIKGLDLEGLRDAIMMSQFDLLGISMPYQWSVPEVVDVLKSIRRMSMDKPIMVGGHPASFYYNELLKEGNLIDFICIGEGEYTVLELVEAIQGSRSLEGIKGLAYRKEGEVIFNGYRELIDNLDELPFPARDMLPIILETTPNFSISISGSRGCSYSGCSFCYIQSFYRSCPGKLWRTRSAKSIAD